MSIKVKQGLITALGKIKDGTFDEDTIRTLLMLSREYIKDEGLIKELAHFIAHPVRNKGLFHKKVNNRYAKWKLVDEQISKMGNITNLLERFPTEDAISDYMLDGVGLDRIEANLFEILYYDGLDDISESHLIKYTRLTKAEALKRLKKYFIKDKGYYELNSDAFKGDIKHLITRKFSPVILEVVGNEIDELLNTSEEVKSLILQKKEELDHLLRVIRGTIEFKSVFNSKGLSLEIVSALTKVIQHFGIDTVYINAIKNRKDEIQLCFMTLLHDSRFVFYDDNVAEAFLCFYLDPRIVYNASDSVIDSPENVLKHGVLALYINYEFLGKSRSYPLFVSSLKISEYLDFSLFSIIDPENLTLKSIPWTTAKRDGGKLVLSSY